MLYFRCTPDVSHTPSCKLLIPVALYSCPGSTVYLIHACCLLGLEERFIYHIVYCTLYMAMMTIRIYLKLRCVILVFYCIHVFLHT